MSSTETKSKSRGFGRFVGLAKGRKDDKKNDAAASDTEQPQVGDENVASGFGQPINNIEEPSDNSEPYGSRDADSDADDSSKRKKGRGESFVRRMRSLSRSRSRSNSRRGKEVGSNQGETIVTVTSCRSDGYYNQKAPGSTTKLPRKAPSNLKLFHELAVGLKDAYAAVGQTPVKPLTIEEGGENMPEDEFQARTVLWEFIGNIDFLLALVDEVAVDTATRGALKDDTTFKGLRDVIKKCNKVLEDMLVRRERRHTLFFRLVQPGDTKDIERIKSWNDKVEKAVGAVTEGQSDSETGASSGMESDTDASSISTDTSSTSKGSMFSRGRQLLPVAGRVRARRATPTPRLRKQRSDKEDKKGGDAAADGFTPGAAEDGFSAPAPVTEGNLSQFQKHAEQQGPIPNGLSVNAAGHDSNAQLASTQPVMPKDELVDIVRGLRIEKMKNREGTAESDLVALKPDWRPKAEIPSAVPKLPIEYIHRHRLMKQVVSCLLEQAGAGPRDTDEETAAGAIITSITSRHGDKAGNGKTILAVAAIQTVEVRERFPDGIAWLHLGRGPLSERDIRRLYEDLYHQVVVKDADLDVDSDDEGDEMPNGGRPADGVSGEANSERQNATQASDKGKSESRKRRLEAIVQRRRRFQGGDIEGIKEEIGRQLTDKKVLICLDDVWRVEDAKWFIFDNQILNGFKPSASKKGQDTHQCRILLTTRTPSLLGAGIVQEVFVRILSEHEAVKLFLSTAGRRPYGGKNSAVFNQAKLIVKGCGNSPLAVRLAGSMLRHSSRSWNLSSPSWSALIQQCRLNLEEASQLRSFVNAVNRVVDLSFFTVNDVRIRVALRRCFVAFAVAFRDNDWMLSGKGIPQSVVLRVFRTIIACDPGSKDVSASMILSMLEKLNLIERARHGVSSLRFDGAQKEESEWEDVEEPAMKAGFQQLFVMHESLKAVAEAMAERSTQTLSPDPDDFTSYVQKIQDEKKLSSEASSLWSAPIRFLTQQLVGAKEQPGFNIDEAHKLVVSALLNVVEGTARKNSISDALRVGQLEIATLAGGENMEQYIAAFLPHHLMKCHAFTSAAELLSDSNFIGRRVAALGIVEATSRHVADLQEFRRVGGSITFPVPQPGTPSKHVHSPDSPARGLDSSGDDVDVPPVASARFDVNGIVRDGSRIIIEEVYRVANKPEGLSDAIGMAICLAAVGDGLLKARQPRDAMMRLEESVAIYRGLLGQHHVNVADALHSVAKALVKLGETRVALLKFAEAARIYEACNATLHFNSIANAQSLASLLVDLGDLDKAQSMYEEVISMRRKVYGDGCVPVAKTINAYAILLAKHGRMNLALINYESAKRTYEAVPAQLIRDPDFEVKCKYDVTLINLNIASIRSKKGDLNEAIACYEDGVRGLREYEAAQAELQKEPKGSDAGIKNTAHKHLVAALGRIGSLKLKVGDNNGALEAYMTLLHEVKEDSPAASQTEKAKAHIKCATIFRQQDGPDSHAHSISHLREALDMYTAIFGPDHKDTAAIASSLRQWLSEDRALTANG